MKMDLIEYCRENEDESYDWNLNGIKNDNKFEGIKKLKSCLKI